MGDGLLGLIHQVVAQRQWLVVGQSNANKEQEQVKTNKEQELVKK
jgi:hypothetical protein